MIRFHVSNTNQNYDFSHDIHFNFHFNSLDSNSLFSLLH